MTRNVRIVLPSLVLLPLVVGACSGAEPSGADLEDFRLRIEEALTSTDPEAAILGLIFTEGMVEWESELAARTASRLAGQARPGTVSFESIPEGFRTVNIVDGAELRPRPEPEGLVVLEGQSESIGSVQIPYGEEDGRYWIVGTRRTVFDEDARDAMLQIMVAGQGSPPIEFRGWCDVRQGDGSTRRIELDDQDVGNQTRVVRGAEIRACEVRNTSGRGMLSLRLQMDDDMIFEDRIEAPDTLLVYPER